MATKLQFKFDPNQDYQLEAIRAITELFNGLSRYEATRTYEDEIVANLHSSIDLSDRMLKANLEAVQTRYNVPREGGLFPEMVMDEGMVLEGIGSETHRCPHFTVEMETGTGKTYVYLRTMYELYRHYGFRKFIIVVPSIAIYEGVRKTFDITASHFRALYDGEFVAPIAYDGAQLSKLRSYATSALPECLIMTLDAFNKKTNNLYKASEKLPGERRPYQFIQETRPIIILDEPQNMESEKAKEAIRTLHPLFVLRYSATHRTSPNPVYRLTPFEAFRRGLVKRIEVDAVTQTNDFNQPFLALQSIAISPKLTATLRTYSSAGGRTREVDVVLDGNDDLYKKTQRDEHQGYEVEDINAAGGYILFKNGVRLVLNETVGPSRPEVFRAQIRCTLEHHMERQEALASRGVKVLSLFFIDRVANYTADNGIIRRIFDEEFERLKRRYPHFRDRSASQVREAYFAKSSKKGDDEVAIDTDGRNNEERKAEKAAFELIMRNKEQLLRLDEPVAFIFAHSALKEGWDNPNVFQICTLNQTVSEVKKRQEIGRGLRLCVDQNGDRLSDEGINTLTVVANESYSSYVDNLQREYAADGVTETPPPPTRARKADAKRNDAHFTSAEFRAFWEKLARQTRYRIQIDTGELVDMCIEKLNNAPYPQPMIVVESGAYVVTRFTLLLETVSGGQARISVTSVNTNDERSSDTKLYKRNDTLANKTGDERLRDYKVMSISGDGTTATVTFANSIELRVGVSYEFESIAVGQRAVQRAELIETRRYPVFNLIDRAARETGLTRPTVNAIFRGLSERTKARLLENPEGFASVFTTTIRETLADHIADRIEFEVLPDPAGVDLEELFPATRRFPQKELIDAGERGLYDFVQQDSDVEVRFVQQRLQRDDKVIFFFKFPPAFKITLPRIIGNYNPDWGIVRHSDDGRITLELVRETKGDPDKTKLQFLSEGRKITSAEKHFAALGIDYRHITPDTLDWDKPAPPKPPRLRGLKK
jgi:type III restriction enzyme